MCGFLGVFTEDQGMLDHFQQNNDYYMRLVARRGPDETTVHRTTDTFISHALLAINDHVTQPIENEDNLLFMNGEFYNAEALSAKNDTEWLLNYLSAHKDISFLDGEFISVFYRKKEREVTIISDPFATKPCFVVVGVNIVAIASYQEPLAQAFGEAVVMEFPPNTRFVYDMKANTVLTHKEVVRWDFVPKNDSYDDWNRAFEESIRKRSATDKQIFLGLSSGYDSGMIVQELINQNRDFISYSIFGAENKETLQKRLDLVNASEKGKAAVVLYDQERYDSHKDFLMNNCSNYPYRSVQGKFIKWMLDDKAGVGLSMICEDAKSTGAKIYLSGQGADEIFSDYATRGPHHGTVRGNYTNVRSKWVNFDQGFQRNFLSKEERVPGAWGIEARYPFLDRYVVQNFLWLSDELKNSEYKQCITQYLRKYKFPFDENQKCGFNPLKSLPRGKILYG